jgi:GH35 family endo-1,4-beta-xylanase
MKIKITAHIHHQKYEWEDKGQYLIYSHKFDDTDYRAHICEQEIEIEVPDNFDPRAQQIAALEKQRQKVMAEYQKTVTEINERINKLQAIEHSI